MGKSRKTPMDLGKRERQLFETVVTLSEASVSDVLANVTNPPSYSAIRATLNLLVDKKWLKYRKDGQKYLYRPAAGKEKAKRNAIQRVLSNVFGDSTTEAVAALLDVSASRLTDEQLQEMIELIETAKRENQS